MKRLVSTAVIVELVLSFGARRLEAQGAASFGPSISQQAAAVPKAALAFYYPWYGNPDITGRWIH